MPSRQTFNYSPHNVCAGGSRKITHLGPRPEPKEQVAKNTPSQQIVYAEYVRSLGTRFPMPEAELVAKVTPRGEGKYLGRDMAGELQAAILGEQAPKAPEPPEETIEQWLQRHKIGKYATATV